MICYATHFHGRRGLDMSDDAPQQVRITPIAAMGCQPGRWSPEAGAQTAALLRRYEIDEADSTLVAEAKDVLARCVAPGRDGTVTGLVVGYVQSGKTLSYTTLAALARDNGYQLVVVITGSSTSLLEQTSSRLLRDLGCGDRTSGPQREWRHYTNPTKQVVVDLRDVLANWRDPESPSWLKPTILLTVMKHYVHLRALNALLSELELGGVSSLIIDDEADQASLNIDVKKGERSATYQRILDVRASIGSHTYLQYTATPQAPLLISVIDELSPDFACVLTPGPAYIGGKALHEEHAHLIRDIPQDDLPGVADVSSEMPPSLLEALKVFVLGAADGIEGGDRNRSMLVHPSSKTDMHREYLERIRSQLDTWKRVLAGSSAAPAQAALATSFEKAYNDLVRTAPSIAPLKVLFRKLLYVLRDTVTHEVNTRQGETPQIDWSRAYAHILVGGQAVNRGFTVEGLTVTYMPRSVGSKLADTIQQRARFLGYKHDYIGLCRVYIESEARDIFRNYVTQEESIHTSLRMFAGTGRRLREWPRAFFCEPDMKPTRSEVLLHSYLLTKDSTEVWPRQPHLDRARMEQNTAAISEFVRGLEQCVAEGTVSATELHGHLRVEGVPLKMLHDGLLSRIRLPDDKEWADWFASVLRVADGCDLEPDAASCVYIMRPRGADARKRSLEGNKIQELYQGPSPARGLEAQGARYPGDRKLRSERMVSVQLHQLRLVDEVGDTPPGCELVGLVALSIPAGFGRTVLVQPQPAQRRWPDG